MPAIAAPKAADVVAVAAVPFGPAQLAERADLVGAGGVPGFGNDLAVGQQRIFGDRFDQRRVGDQFARAIAAQDRRQVEAEAVDVIVVHPMPQAQEDHLADDRMVAVDGVAATGIVAVILAAAGEHVIDLVFEPLEAQRRAVLVAFGGVVEDDVEDDLDAGLVQCADHLLEFVHLAAGLVPAA